MTAAERTELLLIVPAVGLCALIAATQPARVPLGTLLLGSSALLLLQGLLRDLWLLARARRAANDASTPRRARVMCIESSLGITGILAGAVLPLVNLDVQVAIGRAGLTSLALAVLAGGFLMKDYVIEARPWRIRRDKDHVNIIPTWRP